MPVADSATIILTPRTIAGGDGYWTHPDPGESSAVDVKRARAATCAVHGRLLVLGGIETSGDGDACAPCSDLLTVDAGEIVNLVAFLYPAYCAHKALAASKGKEEKTADVRKWLCYFTTIALVSQVEFVTSWLPGYYLFKFIVRARLALALIGAGRSQECPVPTEYVGSR